MNGPVKPASVKISEAPGGLDTKGFKITLQQVDCPPGCKSVLFGSDCVICFRVKVEISF